MSKWNPRFYWKILLLLSKLKYFQYSNCQHFSRLAKLAVKYIWQFQSCLHQLSIYSHDSALLERHLGRKVPDWPIQHLKNSRWWNVIVENELTNTSISTSSRNNLYVCYILINVNWCINVKLIISWNKCLFQYFICIYLSKVIEVINYFCQVIEK